MKAEFLYNPSDGGQHGHCPFLFELKNGDFLATWYAYPGDHDYQGAKLVLAHKPEGADWGKPTIILDEFQSSAGNPMLMQDAQSERVFLLFVLLKGKYWNDAVLHGCYSDDLGRTWSRPQTIWPEKGLMVRHQPVVLDTGEFLVPAYDEVTNHSLLLRGNGMEWELFEAFPDVPLIQPALLSKNDTELVLVFRPTLSDERIIWRAYSKDFGKSWSDVIRTTLNCPLSAIDAFYISDMLAVVHNPNPESRFPLAISFSRDGGISWPVTWNMDASEHEVSYPSFIVARDGSVHGLYSYNRRMIKYVSFESSELKSRYG